MPAKGSSSNNSFGSAAMAIAIPSARRWPWGRLRAQVFNSAQTQIVENLYRAIGEARLISARLRASEIDAEARSSTEQLVGDNDVLQRCHFFEDR
jgi:hypothetical protein